MKHCCKKATDLENEPNPTVGCAKSAPAFQWWARRVQRSQACADCVNLSACAHASTHRQTRLCPPYPTANFVKTNPLLRNKCSSREGRHASVNASAIADYCILQWAA